jgi:hypothetical protein
VVLVVVAASSAVAMEVMSRWYERNRGRARGHP